MENQEFTDITMLVPLIFIAAIGIYRIIRYRYLLKKRAKRYPISDLIMQALFNSSPTKDVKL